MTISEDDTFNKLKRKPLSEVEQIWYTEYEVWVALAAAVAKETRNYTKCDPWGDFLIHHGYTRDEWFDYTDLMQTPT